MAKTCVACNKSIGLLTVRIPLIDNEEVFICSDCFEKMPSIINDLYHKSVNPYKEELLIIKEDVLSELRQKEFNVETINIVTKFLDYRIRIAKEKIEDDGSIVQKICPICKRKVTYEAGSCSFCGYNFSSFFESFDLKEIAEIYNGRNEQYRNNPFYEYDYIVVPNKIDGSTDKEVIAKIIQEHAFQGWRLKFMYSNETLCGVNVTLSEDVLLFERCIKN